MTGVFDAIGTPEERSEATLRKALESRRDNWPHEGYHYRSAGDLLLRHGQFYSGRVLPDAYAHLRGVPGNCFVNAMEACEADSSLLYVEGVYAIGSRHYTPHAWCLDPQGRLLEVSLPTDPEVIEHGIDVTTGLPIMGVEHWGYFGAIFHPEFVKAVWDTQEGHVGILDRPSADTTDGHREWRDEWPVLRLPYDPNRRTL